MSRRTKLVLKVAAAMMFFGGVGIAMGEGMAWTSDVPYDPNFSDIGFALAAIGGGVMVWFYGLKQAPQNVTP